MNYRKWNCNCEQLLLLLFFLPQQSQWNFLSDFLLPWKVWLLATEAVT